MSGPQALDDLLEGVVVVVVVAFNGSRGAEDSRAAVEVHYVGPEARERAERLHDLLLNINTVEGEAA